MISRWDNPSYMADMNQETCMLAVKPPEQINK